MEKLKTSLTRNNLVRLKAGEEILFSGDLHTARDQAHQKLVEIIRKGKNLPLELKNEIIYYCGPTATPKGKAIGSCGPTTSSRMDDFVEPLLKKGLLAMVGKGRRSKKVREAIKKYKSVYFIAPSGCGALLAEKVVAKKLICFGNLGPEAIYRLEVKDFPLIVAIDSSGKSIYEDL
ncbi:MAG: FumA C-terminus/TtdB family hydratase beta subunit [Omnitrophica bacterium]|nr:FumA C-terminus/TtdB family hydratase beta subunit [Candidatus Omnitrophota bacterium]